MQLMVDSSFNVVLQGKFHKARWCEFEINSQNQTFLIGSSFPNKRVTESCLFACLYAHARWLTQGVTCGLTLMIQCDLFCFCFYGVRCFSDLLGGLLLRINCRSWCHIFFSWVFYCILGTGAFGFLPPLHRICIWCRCIGSCSWLFRVSFCFWVLWWHCIVFCLVCSCVLVVCLVWRLLFSVANL